MKYEKEIDGILKELFMEDWMDDEDHKECIELSLRIKGITKQTFSDQLEVGVKNGHSVEQQLDILRLILK